MFLSFGLAIGNRARLLAYHCQRLWLSRACNLTKRRDGMFSQYSGSAQCRLLNRRAFSVGSRVLRKAIRTTDLGEFLSPVWPERQNHSAVFGQGAVL